ncbi:hypothetical protein V1527DRAFT_478222, partial [Lipomyces starkeyi]
MSTVRDTFWFITVQRQAVEKNLKSTQESASTRCSSAANLQCKSRHAFIIIVVIAVARAMTFVSSCTPELNDPTQFPTKYACLFSRKHTSVV